jgi:GT2 family glycosyltransferase
MKLGIGIATYLRKDGKSKFFLERCLNHIKKQTHQDYKVFLIGDKYENHDEFLNLCHSIIDPDKIYFENLPYAKERDIYTDNPNNLWCAGGCNAMNLGVEKA